MGPYVPVASDDSSTNVSIPPRAEGESAIRKHVHAALFGGPKPADVTRDGVPSAVGRFRTTRVLGSGGMGTVLAGYDDELERPVAVKLLHREIGVQHAERLRREAKALAKLSHPNVVTVYEVGTHQGRLFIAMEQVEGVTLGTWMRAEEHSIDALLDVFLQTGQGLVAAHARGLIHRDFKPDNVIVGEDGRPRILDFGLVHAADEEEADDAMHAPASPPEDMALAETGPGDTPPPGSGSLTETGTVLGTPAYMPWEQLCGAQTTEASDQFAFCVSIYEALYGQLPFATNTRSQLLIDIEEGRRVPPPAARTVPAWLRRVILRGLQPSVEDRWPDMRALLTALDPMPRRRRRNRLALGVAGVAAIVVTQQLGSDAEPCAGVDRQLDGAWDEEASARLDRKFEGSAAWPHVRTSLDTFANQWRGYWLEACRATHVEGSQSADALDKRMACLDHHRGRLRAFVQGLQDGDVEVVARAATQVEGLDAGQGCGDSLAMVGQVPPPSNPERRATFHRIIDNAQASSLEAQLLGNPTEALAELEQLQREAVELDHPRALRFVAVARGDAFDELDETDNSIEAHETAMRHAEAAGDDMAALDIASALIYLHATRVLDPVKAEMWSTLAENKLVRVGAVPMPILSGLRINQATALKMNGKFQASVDLLTEVTAMLPAEGYERRRSTALHNRAAAYRDLGELELATKDLLEATALRVALLGPHHRLTGASKLQLAYLLAEQGANVEADATLAEAIAILRGANGTARDLVEAQQTRAIFAAQRGDLESAIELIKPAIEEGVRVLGAEAEDVTNMQYNLARMLLMVDRTDEAMAAARRSLDALEKKYGPDHPPLATDLGLVAQIQMQQRRPKSALETLERALNLPNSDIARAELEALSIAVHLSMHCDAERARADAQAEIRRLEQLDSTPGIDAAIAQLGDQSKSWVDGSLPESCGAVAKADAEQPPGETSEPG